MSTSGSFTPAGAAPCPAPMTRAALLALRTAGSLRTECHYIITDGPTIGTAGNTSATQIELHAVSATELGLEAKVHTTFDNTAWVGFYDIDLGTAGSLVYLTDPANNRVNDTDANAPTVHTQFPWHAWGANLRDNLINDSILTGWGAAINAGGTITDNEIRDSLVNLTGRTNPTSRFERNRLSNAAITLSTALSFFDQNNVDSGTVSHLGAGAGSFSYQNNTMLTGQFQVDAATTSQVTANSNVFGGTAGGYRVLVEGFTGALVIISGNRLFDQGSAGYDLRVSGTGETHVTTSSITTGTINLDGSGDAILDGNTMANAAIDKDAASSGELHMTGNQFSNATLIVGPSNAAVDNLVELSVIRGGTLDLQGPVTGGGRNDFLGTTILTLDVGVSATASAGVTLDGGLYNEGTIIQTRTGGTPSLSLTACTTLGSGCLVTNSGPTVPVSQIELRQVALISSQVDLTGITTGNVLDVQMIQSSLDVTGAAVVEGGQMTKTALTTGGFSIDTFDIVGGTHTLTANQSDRVRNALGSNLI